ncbi:MAG: hypothetical protein ACRDZ8_21665 [Acidimicrobiales bacterium]
MTVPVSWQAPVAPDLVPEPVVEPVAAASEPGPVVPVLTRTPAETPPPTAQRQQGSG